MEDITSLLQKCYEIVTFRSFPGDASGLVPERHRLTVSCLLQKIEMKDFYNFPLHALQLPLSV